MKKIGILILILLFAFTTFAFAADSTFEKDLQDFVKLVQDNKGWYFEETSYGYMAMYYIDIGKEDYYYISQKRYTLSDMNNKKLRLSSSGGSPYIRDSRILNQEKENFRIENGKVVSILDYDTYLIKTDCKTEAEATAYLSKKYGNISQFIIRPGWRCVRHKQNYFLLGLYILFHHGYRTFRVYNRVEGQKLKKTPERNRTP